MEISMEVLLIILRIAQVLVVPVLAWLVREILVNRREIERLRSDVARHEDKLECLPDDSSLHQLSLEISGLRGEVRTVDEKISGIEKVVSRLDRVVERQETYLLNQGGGK